MGGRSSKEIGAELSRLMQEQIKDFQDRAFLGMAEEEYRRADERLNRIREVAADYLAALKRESR